MQMGLGKYSIIKMGIKFKASEITKIEFLKLIFIISLT